MADNQQIRLDLRGLLDSEMNRAHDLVKDLDPVKYLKNCRMMAEKNREQMVETEGLIEQYKQELEAYRFGDPRRKIYDDGLRVLKMEHEGWKTWTERWEQWASEAEAAQPSETDGV